MKKRLTIQIERLPAATLVTALEKAYARRDEAIGDIKALSGRLPKPTKAEQAARKQARDDDGLLNDYQRRIAQLASLITVLTIANENDHDALANEDGARALSIAMDLAQQCRADYDGRLGDLVGKGMNAELVEKLATLSGKGRQ